MKHVHHVHRERRDAVLRSMREHGGGGLAVVPTAPEVARNRDSLYPYRHDSYFYYLSGFPEPDR
jgi:Xaa-Pro aminopeptidase